MRSLHVLIALAVLALCGQSAKAQCGVSLVGGQVRFVPSFGLQQSFGVQSFAFQQAPVIVQQPVFVQQQAAFGVRLGRSRGRAFVGNNVVVAGGRNVVAFDRNGRVRLRR